MNFIQNNKIIFHSLTILGFLLGAVSLFLLKNSEQSNENTWLFYSMFISVLMFHIGFIPTTYVSWFKDRAHNFKYYLELSFFGFFTIAIISVFVLIGVLFIGNT